MNTTTRTPNIRVERIQGRLRIMDATARRIVRDELNELLRIETQLKNMWNDRAKDDQKLICQFRKKIEDHYNGTSYERENASGI